MCACQCVVHIHELVGFFKALVKNFPVIRITIKIRRKTEEESECTITSQQQICITYNQHE